MVIAPCGFMLTKLAAEFKLQGIPFHNPFRPTHGGWNPLRGAGKLLAYLRPDPSTWGEDSRDWTWEDLHQWIEPLQAKGNFSRGAKSVVEGMVTSTSMLEDNSSKTKMVTAEDLRALAADDEIYRQLWNPDWWRGALRGSRAKQFDYPLRIFDERGGAALREQPKIILGTIHSVKGGEADHVFVVPDLSRAAMTGGWETKGQNRDAIIRQFYVAFTRARKSLTLLAPATSFYAQLPRPS